jgi:circadian clock protein KaiB
MSVERSKPRRPRAPRSAASSRATPTPPRRQSEAAKRRLEQAARAEQSRRYVLRLYVTGLTPASSRAIETVRRICEQHLQGRYELEVIDIYQKPALARDEQIIAAPTLIKVLPLPLRRFIGDLSKVDKVLFGLDLRENG